MAAPADNRLEINPFLYKPFSGYALDIRARTELSIFNTFTINKLDASKEYYNLYISEHQKYAKKQPPKGYEWLAFRRQQKNKSKYKTMYR
jgi:hypothetical protein